MADELTSGPSAFETSESGQPQTSADSTPQQSTPEGGSQQTSAKPVNLHELPEFRQYQATVDRKMAQLQAQLGQFEQNRHEQAMAGMDDVQRRDYLLSLKDRELQSYREQMAQAQQAQQRMSDIQRLSDWSGAPAKVLEAAETYDDAVRLAFGYVKENGTAAQQAQAERAAANKVDLGGGKPITPEDQRKKQADELLAKGDTRSYFKMLLEG